MFLYHTPDQLRTCAASEAQSGQWHMAEQFAGQLLDTHPADPTALNVMGRVAMHATRHAAAARFFAAAMAASPGFKPAKKNLALAEQAAATAPPVGAAPRYLLIREWGAGFWADVDHVLGQVLLAEITGRIPIVHWGQGSRFGDRTSADNWTRFFEPVSAATLADIQDRGLTCFPGKWNSTPWNARVPNRWAGPDSRTTGLATLASDAQVVVSDFFYSVACARAWIEPGHRLYGASLHTVYRDLLRTYARPSKAIVDAVDAFAAANFMPRPVMAVHFRGTDKHLETQPFGDLAGQYPAALDAMDRRLRPARVFLMTDQQSALDEFRALLGERLIATDAFRANSGRGIHFHNAVPGPQLGREVLIDTLLATRADAFVGFGPSNVSGMITLLRQWPVDHAALIGPSYLEWRRPGVYLCPPASELDDEAPASTPAPA
ncbi:MAG: O-fucosyltransferase family protein [Phycisphaerales bacterium]